MECSLCLKHHAFLYECADCSCKVGKCCLVGMLCSECERNVTRKPRKQGKNEKKKQRNKMPNVLLCDQCSRRTVKTIRCITCNRDIGLCCFKGKKCVKCVGDKNKGYTAEYVMSLGNVSSPPLCTPEDTAMQGIVTSTPDSKAFTQTAKYIMTLDTVGAVPMSSPGLCTPEDIAMQGIVLPVTSTPVKALYGTLPMSSPGLCIPEDTAMQGIDVDPPVTLHVITPDTPEVWSLTVPTLEDADVDPEVTFLINDILGIIEKKEVDSMKKSKRKQKINYCTVCKGYVKGQLSKHMRKSHGQSSESARKGKAFNNAVKKASLKGSSEGEKVKTFKCSICGKKAKSVYHHIEKYHLEQVSFFDESGERKKDKDRLKNAVASCEVVTCDTPNKLYVCPVVGCASVVKRVSQHIRRCHKEITVEERKETLAKSRIPFKTEMEVDISPLKAVSRLRDAFLNGGDIQVEDILATSLNDQQDGDADADDVRSDGDDLDSDGDKQTKQDGMILNDQQVDGNGDDDVGYDDDALDTDGDKTRVLSEFGEAFLSKYFLFLISPSGAFRKPDSSEKEIGRVRDMLCYLPIEDTLQPLVDIDMVESKILHDFRMAVTKRGEAKSNSTMATYMQYLINLLQYIVTKQLFGHVGVTSEAVHAMKNTLMHTRKNFLNASKKDCRVREDKETDHINENLSVKKVHQYKEYATERAFELFERYVAPNVPDTVDQDDYCTMRDYIMIDMSMRITQRDGVYCNLRHSEVDAATVLGDGWIVKVAEHKGADNHGAARVTLDQESMSRLIVFANIVRPLMEPMFEQLKKQNKEKESHELTRYVFAPWPKKGGHGRMQPGSTSKVLTRRFQEAKCIDKDEHLSCNDFRKVAVATFELNFPGDVSRRQKLAKSMTHMPSTAVSHYERYRRPLDDFKVQTDMANLFGIPSTVDSEDTQASAEPIIVHTPRRPYAKWKAEDDAEMEEVVSSSPSEQLRTSAGILMVTPPRLKEEYGAERCIQKCRRIWSPKVEDKSELPLYLRLRRGRKDGALTIEEENALYSICKEQIGLTAAGNIPKNEKVTSIPYLKILVQPTGLGDRYGIGQIRTKVATWVAKEQEKQEQEKLGNEQSDQKSVCRDAAE